MLLSSKARNDCVFYSDLDNYTAADFLDQPPNFLPHVQDKTILEWGFDVHRLWKVLARKV